MALSKRFVGVDKLGNAVPGIVIILPGRRIFFRQIGDDKADRVQVPQLVQLLDRALVKLGRTPPKATLRRGYAPQERVQVSVDVEGAFAKPDDADGKIAASAVLGAYYPLAGWLMPGVQLRGGVGHLDFASASAALRFRRPFSGDLGEWSLTVDGGFAHTGDVVAGGQLGAQFALYPSLAIRLHVGARYAGANDALFAAVAGLGLGFLF